MPASNRVGTRSKSNGIVGADSLALALAATGKKVSKAEQKRLDRLATEKAAEGIIAAAAAKKIRDDKAEASKIARESKASEKATAKERKRVQEEEEKAARDSAASTSEMDVEVDESESSSNVLDGESSEADVTKWLAKHNFDKDIKKIFEKWTASALFELPKIDMLDMMEGHKAEGLRLFTLLSIMRAKRTILDVQDQDNSVVYLGRKRDRDETSKDVTSGKTGANYFLNLDGVLCYHVDKTKGGRFVRRAGVLIRISGQAAFEDINLPNDIEFTAEGFIRNMEALHLQGTLMSCGSDVIGRRGDDVSSRAFYWGQVRDLAVFKHSEVLNNFLESKGSLSDLWAFSLLSFSRNGKALQNLGHIYSVEGISQIVRTLQNVDVAYVVVGGMMIWMNVTLFVRTWLLSAEASKWSPAFLFFRMQMGYFNFLYQVSTMKSSDLIIKDYADRGQEGWRDLLQLHLKEATVVSKEAEDQFIKQIADKIVWVQPGAVELDSKKDKQAKPEKPQKDKAEKGKLGNKVITGAPGEKPLCANNLGNQLAVMDPKKNNVLMTCTFDSKKCRFAHISLKGHTKENVLKRLVSVPDSLRALLTPAVEKFSSVAFKQ